MGAGHDHGVGRNANSRRLAITLGLVTLYMVAEVVGGLLTNSLALLADAGHMLSDADPSWVGWVPYGVPWRMGADEATSIHLPVGASVAGVKLEPGWYSLYAVPGEREWQIVVNREARRWGTPIDESVRAADIGHGTVPTHGTDSPEDLLRMHFERSGENASDLIVRWDRTAVRIPVVLRPAR